jgi:osmotically-inducible protein OsmY
MRKSDEQLQHDVTEELHWDPSIGRAEIGVVARDGVVTLTGQVDSFAKRWAALRAAERVAGVTAVADEMLVHLPTDYKRTDIDVAHAVTNALRWDVEVPDDTIKARVDDGWVSMSGQVEWEYQRTAAIRAVRNLTGVRGVTNNITLKPRAFAPEVKTRIESALKRTAEADASHISVLATEGEVILRGKVHSWSARDDAERAAWSAPGVSRVKDELVVQSF